MVSGFWFLVSRKSFSGGAGLRARPDLPSMAALDFHVSRVTFLNNGNYKKK
jgi:hypothetical protein